MLVATFLMIYLKTVIFTGSLQVDKYFIFISLPDFSSSTCLNPTKYYRVDDDAAKPWVKQMDSTEEINAIINIMGVLYPLRAPASNLT